MRKVSDQINIALLHDALVKAGDALLSAELHYGRLRDALKHWHTCLCVASGIDTTSLEMNNALHLASGRAIATDQAAFCINDIMRTRAFVRALHAAIQKQRQQFPHRAVEVLYAGTGPFATLIMPLLTRLPPTAVQFTLLEANPQSFALLQQIIHHHKAGAYVRALHCVDACTYEITSGASPDVLISEVLQRSLRDEPQVPLMLWLCAQLPPHCIVLPERITVQLAHRLHNSGMPAQFTILGEAFTLDRATALQLRAALEQTGNIRAATERIFALPEPCDLCWLTTLQVYATEHLRVRESILTLPEPVQIPVRGKYCRVWYELEGRKQLRVEDVPCEV
jgi:hypothetical protein